MSFASTVFISRAAARALVVVFAAAGATATAQTPWPIDLTKRHDPSQFVFLAPLLRGVDIVSLGESIHLTREFPQVRYAAIRYLNDSLGFSTVAFEGSATDLWIAQDRLLESARTPEDVKQSLGGLFNIWNTEEVRELIDYEVASWTSARPMYVTAYDIQPGTGGGLRGAAVFPALLERLQRYAPPPQDAMDPTIVAAWLSPLARSCRTYTAEHNARVDAAIGSVQRWIAAAAPAVEAKHPAVPHAAALRLIPANLRASQRLCRDLGPGLDWKRYKPLRDTHAAAYTMELREAMPGRKLILWAHLSHVGHNSGGGLTSVGEILHRELGPRLYTIMAFAESGRTNLIYSDVDDDIRFERVRGTTGPLGKRLAALAPTDYFLDLRSSTDSMYQSPNALAVEAFPTPVAIARDFDGIFWIKTVHAPTFADPKMERMLMLLGAIRYLKFAGILAVVAVAYWLMRRFRRRRSRRVQPVPA